MKVSGQNESPARQVVVRVCGSGKENRSKVRLPHKKCRKEIYVAASGQSPALLFPAMVSPSMAGPNSK